MEHRGGKQPLPLLPCVAVYEKQLQRDVIFEETVITRKQNKDRVSCPHTESAADDLYSLGARLRKYEVRLN